ncbi:MAG TPA: sterol desaturase family protein [Pyrinomonadaceae bacterium]|jgi:4-hydroxysphinganine ceramide fatty acyl 2-hydroxylase
MVADSVSARTSLAFYKRQQAAFSRRRLLPVTAFYTAYTVVMLALALRTPHPFRALAFFLLGVPVWTLVEYTSHRFVFHRHFKQSKKAYKKFYTGLANKYLDPLHFGHHERPTDALHISGRLRDLMPLFVISVVVSCLVSPIYSLPVLLAGVVQCYVIEEWTHHCMHYYNFRLPYFRRIKAYHLYHHSSRGIDLGYGITNEFWDIVFRTRFPPHVRARLNSGAAGRAANATNANQLELSRQG